MLGDTLPEPLELLPELLPLDGVAVPVPPATLMVLFTTGQIPAVVQALK